MYLVYSVLQTLRTVQWRLKIVSGDHKNKFGGRYMNITPPHSHHISGEQFSSLNASLLGYGQTEIVLFRKMTYLAANALT